MEKIFMFQNVRKLAARYFGKPPSDGSRSPQPSELVRVSDAATPDDRARTALQSGLMRGLFSQLGEDGTLLWIFEGKKGGFYVDIGCHNPLVYSNTAALHHWHQWHGLNVDIDRRAIDLFDEWRPADINVLAGVGSREGSLDAFIFQAGALSTLDPNVAASPHLAHVDRESTKIEVLTLRNLLAKHLPAKQQIDLLNVDAEGLDYEVLSSNDWDIYKPSVVSVEAQGFDPANPGADRVFQLLTGMNYRLISHTVITSIYRLQSP